MKYITGIDIGTERITAAIFAKEKKDVRFVGIEKTGSRGVACGGVADSASLTDCIYAFMGMIQKRAQGHHELFLCVSNPTLRNVPSQGMVALSHYGSTVTERDIARCCAIGNMCRIPVSRTVMHSVVEGFTVDNQHNILNPKDMIGTKLSVAMQLITVDAAVLKNFEKCFEKAGHFLSGFVYQALAASSRVLRLEEIAGGVLLIDMGNSKMDVAYFRNRKLQCCFGRVGAGTRDVRKSEAVDKDALRLIIEELHREVRERIADPIPKIVMVGGGSVNEDTIETVERTFGAEVRLGSCVVREGERIAQPVALYNNCLGTVDFIVEERKNNIRQAPLLKRAFGSLSDLLNSYF